MADAAAGALPLPPPTYPPLPLCPPCTSYSLPTLPTRPPFPIPHTPQNQVDVGDQPGIFIRFTRFITSFNYRPAIRVRSSFFRHNAFHLLPTQVVNTTPNSSILSLIAAFLSTLALKTYHLLFLLYLPLIHSSRARPLLTAIKRLADECQRVLDPAALPHLLSLIGHAWTVFRNSSISEWKLLMVTHAFLIGFVSAIFQLTSTIVDPATCTAAFVSIACAFLGIMCGVVLTIHFHTAPGVLEDRTVDRFIQAEKQYYAWFNIWVLLALPVVWTAWSTISLIVFVLLVIWHIYPMTEPHSDPGFMSKLTVPIAVTGVLSIGCLYLVLAFRILRSWWNDLWPLWNIIALFTENVWFEKSGINSGGDSGDQFGGISWA